jgi:hypothetical protein
VPIGKPITAWGFSLGRLNGSWSGCATSMTLDGAQLRIQGGWRRSMFGFAAA